MSVERAPNAKCHMCGHKSATDLFVYSRFTKRWYCSNWDACVSRREKDAA